MAEDWDDLGEVHQVIESAIHDDPPYTLREGRLIKKGHSNELDELRAISSEGKGWIAGIELRERERTGISSLKVSYNRVFGYYIEVTRTNLANVPQDFIRKQTLANAERFITPELKEYEEKVLGAEEKILDWSTGCSSRCGNRWLRRPSGSRTWRGGWQSSIALFHLLKQRQTTIIPVP